ncbi:MAG: futalosine hydrolase, partial [Nitrospirae bacterium]|nr:futalosine hydrolase [Nitrospirota bacterium]
MKFLAILTSSAFESDILRSLLKNVRINKFAGKDVCQGKIFGTNVILMNTGIGKVNAGHSATCILEDYQVSKVINSGVGGAYPGSGLRVGDIAVATNEIYGDDGVATSTGFEGMDKIGIPVLKIGRKKYFNEFPLDNILLKRVSNLVTRHACLPDRQALPVTKVRSGNFVTVSATSGTQKRALELERRFKAICENMEGAAIAHICAMYRIPMLEIRGISNIAGVR